MVLYSISAKRVVKKDQSDLANLSADKTIANRVFWYYKVMVALGLGSLKVYVSIILCFFLECISLIYVIYPHIARVGHCTTLYM